MNPLSLIRGVLDTAEDTARALVGRERIRLAVTGLSRAGKTVFLTSLIANLLAAGRGARTLPALSDAAGGRIRRVFVVPAGAETVPRFDPDAHLGALAADPPRWPERRHRTWRRLSATVPGWTIRWKKPPPTRWRMRCWPRCRGKTRWRVRLEQRSGGWRVVLRWRCTGRMLLR